MVHLIIFIFALLLVVVSGLFAFLLTSSVLATAPLPGSTIGPSTTTLPLSNNADTSTPTASPTDTPTPVPTDTPTPTPSPTDTPTPVPTDTPTSTPLPTDTPTPRVTRTPTPVPTHVPTPTATALPRPTATTPGKPHATPTTPSSHSRRGTATPPVHPTSVSHTLGGTPPPAGGTPIQSAIPLKTQGGFQADDQGVSILVAVIVNIGAAVVLALLVAITQLVDKLTLLRKRKVSSYSPRWRG